MPLRLAVCASSVDIPAKPAPLRDAAQKLWEHGKLPVPGGQASAVLQGRLYQGAYSVIISRRKNEGKDAFICT
jgi:hypothetical protein